MSGEFSNGELLSHTIVYDNIVILEKIRKEEH